ncbi:hypothetical protein DFH06DRAFT_178468 [Mycena polygramma]|nr:hypothetical protein DFH06DRAFT_178468 [Mycena polygramma]
MNTTTTIHPPLVLKVLYWIVLAVPPSYSALLYVREKEGVPPSPVSWGLTSYGLFFAALCIPFSGIGNRLSPRCRLIEPGAIYLTIVLFCLRAPPGTNIYDPDPFQALFWLGIFTPLLTGACWNGALVHHEREDRLITHEYLGEFFGEMRECFRSGESAVNAIVSAPVAVSTPVVVSTPVAVSVQAGPPEPPNEGGGGKLAQAPKIVCIQY